MTKLKPSNKSDRKKTLLLLVDSDAKDLSNVSKLLQRFDYHVFTASSAREALDVLTTALPALIIISPDLKDMDGLKFAQTIKKSQELSGIPFIALTKPGDRDEEKRSFSYGAIDVIPKPVSAEQLYRSVQTVMESTPRTNIRIRMLLPVKITNPQHGDAERTCMLDLSENGIFVVTENPPAVNTKLTLLINLNGKLIPADAEVLRIIRMGEGPHEESGMGLKFIKINPADQELIRQFIKDEVTRGIPLGKV